MNEIPSAFDEKTLKLPGVIFLIKETIFIYRKKLATIVGISSVSLLVGILLNLILYFLPKDSFIIFNISESFDLSLFFYLTISVFSTIIALIFQTWSYLALIYAIKDEGENLGIKQSYALSWKIILSYWWIAFLMGFVSMGGLFLLIIPGLIFSLWFLFAPIILVMEGARGMDALLKSKHYVKGKLIDLFWRLFVVFLIIFAFLVLFFLATSGYNLIFQVGTTIFSFLIFPFLIIYYFLIYNCLKKIKTDQAFTPSLKERKIFVFVGALGLVLPVLLTLASLLAVKQFFIKWDVILDARRKSDIYLIDTAMNIYYEANKEYPEITLINGRINLTNIGQNLIDVPLDPGLGKIKGCNNIKGAPYLGFDNAADRGKYCIFTCLNDGSFVIASHNGIRISDKIPSDLDCGEEAIEIDETLGWKTYKNNQYGFEMKYPENYLFSDPKMESFDCDYLDFSGQCPYIPVSYLKIEKQEEIEEAINKGFLKTEKVKINNKDYCFQQTEEGAAGSNYTTYYYTAIKDNKCIFVTFILQDANCGVFGTPEDENYQKCEQYQNIEKPEILKKIISTFNFLD